MEPSPMETFTYETSTYGIFTYGTRLFFMVNQISCPDAKSTQQANLGTPSYGWTVSTGYPEVLRHSDVTSMSRERGAVYG
eukprot:426274-Amorphochlora_amoeboformis.AAC.1